MGLILAGCSRRETLPGIEENATADQHLPFEAPSDKAGIFPHRFSGAHGDPGCICWDYPRAVVVIERQFSRW